jgi:hypothetical protein
MDNNHDDCDDLIVELARLDPVLDDPAPEPSSLRFENLKEQIMSSTVAPPSREIDQQAVRPTPRRAPRRPAVLTAAAVLVAMVGLGLAAVLPGGSSEAAAQLLAAAENTAEITDLRVEVVSDHGDFPAGGMKGEIDGDNIHLYGGDLDVYQIGDKAWGSTEGGPFEPIATHGPGLAPFAQSSANLITTALRSGSVTEEAPDEVRGVPTTRYVLELDDEARADIGNLPDDVLAWFAIFVSSTTEDATGEVTDQVSYSEIERADELVVWTADDLVHQITVTSDSGVSTMTFSDLGDDITVDPPFDIGS